MSGKGQMLRFRIISGVVLVGFLLAATLWLPLSWLAVVFEVIAELGAAETLGLLKYAGIEREQGVGVVAAVLLACSPWSGVWWDPDPFGGKGAMLVLVCFVATLLVVVLIRKKGRPLQSIPATLLAVLYAPFLLSFLAWIVVDCPEGDGRHLALYMILVVKVTDIGAYFAGSALGRHKAFPQISPGKTWEGCMGGVACATAASLLVWRVTGGSLGSWTFGAMDALILGLILSVAGILGDLVESMFKRAADVKDSGDWIPGMGGVLDVIDSLLLASPVLYLYVHVLQA